MPGRRLFAGVILLLLLDLIIVFGNQGPQRLNLGVILREYYGVVYTDQPALPARHAYFDSEQIVVSIEIANTTDRSHRISPTGYSLKEFRVITRQSPVPGQVGRLVMDPQGRLLAGGIVSEVDGGRPFDLEPQASVTWRATFETEAVPGYYEFQILPETLSADMPISPQATLIRYEMRQINTVAAQAEMARRRVIREYNFGTDDTVADAVSTLLGVYPESAVAYQITGMVAERGKRTAEARAAYSQAIQLLSTGADRLQVQNANRRETQSLLSGLKKALQALP